MKKHVMVDAFQVMRIPVFQFQSTADYSKHKPVMRNHRRVKKTPQQGHMLISETKHNLTTRFFSTQQQKLFIELSLFIPCD